jgi:hypothetical protein
MRVGGMKWVAKRILWVTWRDAGVGVVQAIVEGHDGRVGGLVKDLGHDSDAVVPESKVG